MLSLQMPEIIKQTTNFLFFLKQIIKENTFELIRTYLPKKTELEEMDNLDNTKDFTIQGFFSIHDEELIQDFKSLTKKPLEEALKDIIDVSILFMKDSDKDAIISYKSEKNENTGVIKVTVTIKNSNILYKKYVYSADLIF